MTYTRELLLWCYLDRFLAGGIEISKCEKLFKDAEKLYDEVGKDQFRTYASLDSKTIKEFLSK